MHSSQPLRPSSTFRPADGRLLRNLRLDVTEYQTLASLGIPMRVIGVNARLLRDMAQRHELHENSITLAGGESIDVILDACQVRAATGTCTTAYAAGLTTSTRPTSTPVKRRRELRRLMTEVHITRESGDEPNNHESVTP